MISDVFDDEEINKDVQYTSKMLNVLNQLTGNYFFWKLLGKRDVVKIF